MKDEAKGKVEAGVKYVKTSFLYAEDFPSWDDLRQRLQEWLDQVANPRIHGTTREIPRDVYESRERPMMKAYLRPSLQEPGPGGETRRVDKTALIAHRGNRYSVPQVYQQGTVRIREEGELLVVQDLHSGEVIARHALKLEKGHTIKNKDHYRDHAKTISDREAEVQSLVGEEAGALLCRVVRTTAPNIYKDQLVGLTRVLAPFVGRVDLTPLLLKLAERPRLTAVRLREFLEAHYSPRSQAAAAAPPVRPVSDTGALAVYRTLHVVPESTVAS